MLEGRMRFDVHISTSVVESDIRKHVLRKACAAVRDANAQLSEDGVNGALPRISIHWLREDLWKLLAIRVQSDNQGRTEDELREAIKSIFADNSASFESLIELCEEENTEAKEVDAAVSRVIRDFRCRRFLVPFGNLDNFILDTGSQAASEFFRVTRSADDIDVLFAGRYASRHEFDMLRSAYGSEYAKQSLVPLISAGFGVNLEADASESSVLAVLRSSPTAVRLLAELSPAPSAWVKRQSLRLAALAGASLDLVRAPDLLLNAEFRQSFRRLSAIVADNQSSFLQFIEELVLVTGYSYDQVYEAMMHSEAAKHEFNNSAEKEHGKQSSVNLQITQQIPKNLPTVAVSFPYLWLAGMRASITVEFLNTPEAPFRVSVNSANDITIPDGPIERIAIGPGLPSLPSRIDMRASMSFEGDAKVVILHICELQDARSRTLPIMIGILSPNSVRSGIPSEMIFGYYWPAITAQCVRSLQQICRSADDGEVELRTVTSNIEAQFSKQSMPCTEAKALVPSDFSNEVIEFLSQIGSDTPLPFGLPEEELQVLGDPQSETRVQLYNSYLGRSMADKVQTTSVILRCASADGKDYRDEYLGMFCGSLFNPPTIVESDELSQEEFNLRWNEPAEDITISSIFPTDLYQLASETRDWAGDPAKPFPLEITSAPPQSPVFKTYGEIINCPKIDRLWYTERPVIVRFRPMKPAEKWHVEANYWESKGDNARAEILRERIAEAANSRA